MRFQRRRKLKTAKGRNLGDKPWFDKDCERNETRDTSEVKIGYAKREIKRPQRNLIKATSKKHKQKIKKG